MAAEWQDGTPWEERLLGSTQITWPRNDPRDPMSLSRPALPQGRFAGGKASAFHAESFAEPGLLLV
jgi:hypothetical protein